jgi:hypothetical protein
MGMGEPMQNYDAVSGSGELAEGDSRPQLTAPSCASLALPRCWPPSGMMGASTVSSPEDPQSDGLPFPLVCLAVGS